MSEMNKKFESVGDVESAEKDLAGPERKLSPEAVMEELSGLHYQALMSFCAKGLRQYRVPQPEEAALDIVQETMLKAWKNVGN